MSRFGRRRRPDGEPLFEFVIPPEWKTARWKFVEPSHTADLPGGGQGLMFSAMLIDGTVLFAVVWTGGQRAVRISPETDWAVEERFTGDVPSGAAEVIGSLWTMVVECAVGAVKAAEREFGGRPR